MIVVVLGLLSTIVVAVVMRITVKFAVPQRNDANDADNR